MSKAKAIEVELVEEPAQLVSKKSVALCNTLGAEDLESSILEALLQTENHRRQSAMWDLRAGVLFHLYRESLKVNGRKYSGFWDRCEERFGVNRATISRKMRLALVWAKEQGADDAALQQLAAAADFEDQNNEAVQLAFDWIGDQTTSDLYRKYKLTNVGPQGGDTSKHPRKDRRSKVEMTEAQELEEALEWWKLAKAGSITVFQARTFSKLPDLELANFIDLHDRMLKEARQVAEARGIKPAKLADWHVGLEALEQL